MAIKIRLLRKEEHALANSFFNGIYKSNRSLADFEWEFVNGPWGPAVYVVAVDDEVTTETKIVGIQCAIPIELADARGKRILTAKSEDTLVDPAYRGKKIFESMYDLLFAECTKMGIHFIWGFTPAKKAFERIGFEIPYQAHQGLIVFNPFSAYAHLSALNAENKFIDKLKIAGLAGMSFVSSFKNIFSASGKLNSALSEAKSKEDVPTRLVPGSPYYFLHMNNAYVEWRIKNNPFRNGYETYEFSERGKVIADVIVNYRANGLGYIEQLIFKEGISDDLRKQTILNVIDLMRKRVNFIRVLCFDFNEELKKQEDLFRACGLIILKRGGHFVWKKTGTENLDPKQLFLTRLFTQGNQ